MSSLDKAIGGYFEFELSSGAGTYHQGVITYQSARAAFLSLLRSLPNVQRVWMPCYICDSMLSSVHAAGKEIVFYNVDSQFYPKRNISLRSSDVLLHVNYFGVCGQQVKELLNEFNSEQIIVDASQSFYSEPSNCLATIYSPRKFFGVPDGGFLATTHPVKLPEDRDEDSVNRMQHLFTRIAFSPELGFKRYKQAEDSLQELEPKRISKLTERLLDSIDYRSIQKQRKENFNYLHERLGKTNQLSLEITDLTALCYPYMPNRQLSREFLRQNKIYIPTYWPEVLSRPHSQGAEEKFVNSLFAVPCDQRYKRSDLDSIIFFMSN